MIWALLCGLFYGALLQDAWCRELERWRVKRVHELERKWYGSDDEPMAYRLSSFDTGTAEEPTTCPWCTWPVSKPASFDFAKAIRTGYEDG